MLAQKNRLSKKDDFELIFRNGNKIFDQYLNLRFRKNDLDCCRFSIIVSNKISKKAVVRNKLRRRIKAFIVNNLSNFRENYDIIITVLPGFIDFKFSDSQIFLLNFFKKAKIL